MTDQEDHLVRFLDLRAIHHNLRPGFATAQARVLDSGRYLLGPELEAFEQRWAAACGAGHAVGVGSGLDALTLVLRALDVGPGHEVPVPSNTFIATWLAVSAVGATPVPVEPDPTTHLVTVDAMAEAVTSRTTALLPVHLYGHPVDVVGLERLAADRGLALVFDAAQAHGATVAGRPVGSFGLASAWSFYPGKNLGALGDGGAVTTNDPELARRLRRLRNYGLSERYVHDERGVNSRLDELQAAFLQVSLDHLAGWNRQRAALASRYTEALVGHGPVVPTVGGASHRPVWHLYVVRSPDRDMLQAHLAAQGIETLIHYPVPPHRQSAYTDLAIPDGSLPVAEMLANEVLSLPIGPHLDERRQDRVIEAVGSWRPNMG